MQHSLDKHDSQQWLLDLKQKLEQEVPYIEWYGSDYHSRLRVREIEEWFALNPARRFRVREISIVERRLCPNGRWAIDLSPRFADDKGTLIGLKHQARPINTDEACAIHVAIAAASRRAVDTTTCRELLDWWDNSPSTFSRKVAASLLLREAVALREQAAHATLWKVAKIVLGDARFAEIIKIAKIATKNGGSR